MHGFNDLELTESLGRITRLKLDDILFEKRINWKRKIGINSLSY